MLAVKRLGPDDWHRARTIRLRALEDSPHAFWTTAEVEVATTSDEWRQRLASPDAVMFAACSDGVDVGLVVGASRRDDPGDAGLSALWVAPEARGQGVGRSLIESVVGWARARRYRTLRLYVADSNADAISLYRRAGFTPTGRMTAFPPPRDHISEHELSLPLQPTE